MKREFNSNLSGNEVYYTACSSLVISKNSCSKLHRHNVLIQSPFHAKSHEPWKSLRKGRGASRYARGEHHAQRRDTVKYVKGFHLKAQGRSWP